MLQFSGMSEMRKILENPVGALQVFLSKKKSEIHLLCILGIACFSGTVSRDGFSF
jgi:hypothetical protein